MASPTLSTEQVRVGNELAVALVPGGTRLVDRWVDDPWHILCLDLVSSPSWAQVPELDGIDVFPNAIHHAEEVGVIIAPAFIIQVVGARFGYHVAATLSMGGLGEHKLAWAFPGWDPRDINGLAEFIVNTYPVETPNSPACTVEGLVTGAVDVWEAARNAGVDPSAFAQLADNLAGTHELDWDELKATITAAIRNPQAA